MVGYDKLKFGEQANGPARLLGRYRLDVPKRRLFETA